MPASAYDATTEMFSGKSIGRSRKTRPAAVAAASRPARRPRRPGRPGCARRPRRAGRRRGAAAARAAPSAEPPEPVAQVGDPAQRPLGAGALDDEVAGEAAVGASVAWSGCRVAAGRRDAVPDLAESGRPAPEQGAHDLAALAGPGRVLDEAERVGVAPGEPGEHPAALAAGGAVHRAEQAELGVVAAGDRAVVDHPLVEVGASRRAWPARGRRSCPASTRGSSWATSATTKVQPSSATAAGRTCTGIDSAPPPFEDQRPVVEPAGW